MSTPTFEFNDGMLQIDTPLARMRLAWRPEPLAEQLTPGMRKWRPFWPDFRLVGSDAQGPPQVDPPEPAAEEATGIRAAAARKAAAFAAFRSELPADMAALVAPFGSHQWPLLLLLHAQPRAIDLATSNPVLAYCLANNNVLRRSRIDVAGVMAVGLSPRKQREILEWLGFPGSEAMVRLMRKLPAGGVALSTLCRLRDAIVVAPGILSTLAHLPALNDAVLALVSHRRIRELVRPSLLREVAATNARQGAESPYDSILSGIALWNEMDPNHEFQAFTSQAQVCRFLEQADAAHREYSEAQKRRAARSLDTMQFAAPPIPGTKDIVAITSVGELRREGREQRNCVGSYFSRVLSGEIYVYQVLKPERATLSITYCDDGCWLRAELAARGNTCVEPATAAHVDAWISAHRLSI